jgi:cytochrome c oxidase cbb3-type subunit 3
MTRPCLFAAAVLALNAACAREERPFKDLNLGASSTQLESQTTLHAGPVPPPTGGASPFQGNGWGISEGKTLYTQYNCSGCHANGGGAIGPALMDDEWRYGYAPANIYSTIIEGRPNGMPSFRNKMPDYQVWQLVSYVLSMSGQSPIDAASGRSDHMQSRRPENLTPYQGRVQTGHK